MQTETKAIIQMKGEKRKVWGQHSLNGGKEEEERGNIQNPKSAAQGATTTTPKQEP